MDKIYKIAFMLYCVIILVSSVVGQSISLNNFNKIYSHEFLKHGDSNYTQNIDGKFDVSDNLLNSIKFKISVYDYSNRNIIDQKLVYEYIENLINELNMSFSNISNNNSIEFCYDYSKVGNVDFYSANTENLFHKLEKFDFIKDPNSINVYILSSNLDWYGFSTFPFKNGITDGVFININNFDKFLPNLSTHLFGNYFGLYSLWGVNACDDDFISDTPLQNAPNANCLNDLHLSTCYSQNNIEEIRDNFMDASICVSSFTDLQKNRMVYYVLNTSKFSLKLNSECNQINNDNIISIYPNPFFNEFIINGYNEKDGFISFKLITVNGVEVYNEKVFIAKGNYTRKINLESNNNTVYVLNVHSNSINITKSIIKIN